MLDVYATFAQDYMAMPVIKGEKTAGERFPGAVNTYTHRSHDAGPQGPAGRHIALPRPEFFQGAGDQVPSAEGREEYCWTTSWGVSTRLVGALVMTHSDDDGLVLPPRLAPAHVVIMPIFRTDEERAAVLDYCHKLERELKGQSYDGEPVRVFYRCARRPRRREGLAAYQAWRAAAPGNRPARCRWRRRLHGPPRQAAERKNRSAAKRIRRGHRDASHRDSGFAISTRALELRTANMRTIDSRDEFVRYFTPKNEDKPEIHGGFALCHWAEDPSLNKLLADLKVTVRCIPLPGQIAGADDQPGKCIFTGKPSSQRAVFAKAY